MTQPYVVVSLRVEGLHSWPQAPEHLSFLRDPHRHEFHVNVKMQVSHEDRAVEIIELKTLVLDHLWRASSSAFSWPNLRDFGVRSCETIAREVAEWLQDMYRSPDVRVEVLEDGENGGYYET